MQEGLEGSVRKWKWIAVASLIVAAGSLLGLIAVVVLSAGKSRMTDTRLIGTWQSDADKTIAGIRERKPMGEQQEAGLRSIFGKLRVTYTPTSYSTDLEGTVNSFDYVVLGTDKQSIVFREIKNRTSPLDSLIEMSEFTIIYFDGPDSYWVYTPGGIREYFKRVR